jgi:hypothetical protein
MYSKIFKFQLPAPTSAHPVDHARFSLSSIIDTRTLSSVVLYNMAFVLTMKGIRSNHISLFTKAMKLYDMSMGLQQTDSGSTSMFATSLTLACCNNIALLAYFQGDFAYAQKMRLFLHGGLLATKSWRLHLSENVPSDDEEEHTNDNDAEIARFLMDDADIQGFNFNLVFMYPPRTAGAA